MDNCLTLGDLVVLRITEIPRRYGLVIDKLNNGLFLILFNDMSLERQSPHILKKL